MAILQAPALNPKGLPTMMTRSQSFAEKYTRSLARYFHLDATRPGVMVTLSLATLQSYIELAHTAGICCEFDRLDTQSTEQTGGLPYSIQESVSESWARHSLQTPQSANNPTHLPSPLKG